MKFKRKLTYIIAAIAMVAVGSASMGCMWVTVDEPRAFKSLCD